MDLDGSWKPPEVWPESSPPLPGWVRTGNGQWQAPEFAPGETKSINLDTTTAHTETFDADAVDADDEAVPAQRPVAETEAATTPAPGAEPASGPQPPAKPASARQRPALTYSAGTLSPSLSEQNEKAAPQLTLAQTSDVVALPIFDDRQEQNRAIRAAVVAGILAAIVAGVVVLVLAAL